MSDNDNDYDGDGTMSDHGTMSGIGNDDDNDSNSEDSDSGDNDGDDDADDDVGVTDRVRRQKYRFPLPELDEGERWVLESKIRVTVTRDHSSAAHNGTVGVFGDDFVFSADCAQHGSPSYWSKKKSQLLVVQCHRTEGIETKKR
jgi:hypothetical protein